VRRESPESVQEVLGEAVKTARKPSTKRTFGREPQASAPSPIKGHGARQEARINIDGHTVHLTNLEKVYWPKEGYKKGDLINYYRQVAPFILPYLEDRPESLHRHPNGIEQKSFFQKNLAQQPPDWVQSIKLRSSKRDINFLLCQDEATLVYMANLGCIEINPWSSRVSALDRPDYVVLDLDPEDLPFDAVVEVALAIRKTLEKAGAEGVCKTSGKRGMHVYLPLGARYDYNQGRQFAEIVARLVNRQLPDLTSVERLPARRRQRVYLDYLQNRRGQTLAAPYSVRPVPGARVSTPLQWKEVKRGLDPSKFTIQTLPKRLDEVGDLWQPVLGPGIDLAACLQRLQA
jgi:bifunctional non-homologous end joining protein LigD